MQAHSALTFLVSLEYSDLLMMPPIQWTRFPPWRDTLVAKHPYELPEVVAIGIGDGHHPYLDWLADPRGRARADET